MKNIFIILFFLVFGFLNSYGQRSIYVVDTVESQMLWYCGNHYGCLKLESGYVSVVKGKISSGSIIIDMNSIVDDDIIDNEMLRITLGNVIKSEQFFEAEKYPSSIFTVLHAERIDSMYYNVSGNLKIKNKAKDIEFDSKIMINEDRFFVESNEINIDRTQWDIKSLSKKYDNNGKDAMYVPDTISLVIYMYANKI